MECFLTTSVTLTSEIVNAATITNWKGNSGTPPAPLFEVDDVDVLLLETILVIEFVLGDVTNDVVTTEVEVAIENVEATLVLGDELTVVDGGADDVPYSRTLLLEESATQRLPPESNARPPGKLSPARVVAALLLVKLG